MNVPSRPDAGLALQAATKALQGAGTQVAACLNASVCRPVLECASLSRQRCSVKCLSVGDSSVFLNEWLGWYEYLCSLHFATYPFRMLQCWRSLAHPALLACVDSLQYDA
jgi:hypothetical protein